MPEGEQGQAGSGVTRICVLPYAGLQTPVVIGPVHFWPWCDPRVRERYIPHRHLLPKVEVEVNRHVNWFGQPLSTQCLVSVTDAVGMRLASGIEPELGPALDLLTFAYLLPVVSQSPPIPEHFDAFVMPLAEPGKEYRLVSGGLHNLMNIVVPDGVPLLRLQQPREVDGITMRQRAYFVTSRPDLCEGIHAELPESEIAAIGGRLLSMPFSADARRAFMAVWWHNLALRQNEVLGAGRAIALSTAFEVLFNVDRSDAKAKGLCSKVDALLSGPVDHRYVVREKKPYYVTRASYVVYKLYKWRNKVVHGDQYDIVDGTIRLRGWGRRNVVLVASRIFGRCFKNLYL